MRLGTFGIGLAMLPKLLPPTRPNPPGTGNRHQPRPGRPPMNGARECARRRRQMAARAARQAKSG